MTHDAPSLTRYNHNQLMEEKKRMEEYFDEVDHDVRCSHLLFAMLQPRTRIPQVSDRSMVVAGNAEDHGGEVRRASFVKERRGGEEMTLLSSSTLYSRLSLYPNIE